MVENQRVDWNKAGDKCGVGSRIGGELAADMGAKRGTSTEEHRAVFETSPRRKNARLDDTTTMAVE